MAEFDGLDFTPDLEDEPIEATVIPEKILPPAKSSTKVINDDVQAVTIKNLVSMTQAHIEDDSRVRDEIDELTEMLDNSVPQMTIKEMLEYLKIKLREREFHQKCINDAYNFVQRSEIAKEMLVGSDRRERVMQAMDNNKLTKIMGFLNMNNKQDLQ